MISSAMQVGKGIKLGLETEGGGGRNNQLEDAREKESSHRRGNAFANVTFTEAEM